jgi:hypothetical protein
LLLREAVATCATIGHIASDGRRSTVLESHLDPRHPGPATGGLRAKNLQIEEARIQIARHDRRPIADSPVATICSTVVGSTVGESALSLLAIGKR